MEASPALDLLENNWEKSFKKFKISILQPGNSIEEINEIKYI